MFQAARTKTPLISALLAICMSLFLVGCGDSIAGTYSADGMGGSMTLELKSGGTAVFTVTSGGQTEKQEGTYAVSGDTVTVTLKKEGAAKFTRQKDGSLSAEGGLSVTLKKK